MKRSAPMVPAVHSAPPPLDAEISRWFREHADFVWRSLRRLGLDPEGAEDGVQEVFCVVHRRLAEFDGRRGSARAWLFAIARRVAAHSRRTDARRERRLQMVSPPEPPATPEDAAARRQAADLVTAALSQMDEAHRVVVHLAQIEGLSAPEIAAALEIPLNTVYSRIRNGRKKFRRLVTESLHRQEDEQDEP